MKAYQHFIGVDISKATLDLAILKQHTVIRQDCIENTPKAIKAYLRDRKQEGVIDRQTLFCCEHTGVYGNHLLSVLVQFEVDVWMEQAYTIKHSMGLQRGKTDKVDAVRIGEYAATFSHKAKLYVPPTEVMAALKVLFTVRKQYVNTKGDLEKMLAERSFLNRTTVKLIKTNNDKVLKALQKAIDGIEKQIQDQIAKDQDLGHKMKLMQSVVGVGFVTALHVLVTSNAFTCITTAKQFACYSGVAPFKHQSGSSVRGKTRVSNMANKAVKATLHMAALSAATTAKKSELYAYYHRKVGEGKNKMSVLNAVRNKIIHRIYACVLNDRMYEPNPQAAH